MKNLMTLFLLLTMFSQLYCQYEGGMLCGGEDEVPIWIIRFKVIDRETHRPIKYASIEVYENKGDGMTWKADNNGVAVLVITDPNCLPYEGKFEITARNYKYYQIYIERTHFRSNEDDKRIFLEGHNHNWTDINQIPGTQELINKIVDKQYQVGVKKINSGHGFAWTNYAPACFEYEIELERSSTYDHSSSDNNYPDQNDNNSSNKQSQIPMIQYNGETIYVFPNNLSNGSYHLEQAKSACNSLNRLGYDDWYLPSKDELNALYLNKEKIGGFEYGWFWSSTSTSTGRRYWTQSFEDGIQATEHKGTTYNIHKGNIKARCVRKYQIATKVTYSKTLKKLFEVSGTKESYQTVIKQMFTMFKKQNSNIGSDVWNDLENEFSKTSLNDLTEMLVPVYSKYMTLGDLQELINFFETPAGKKFAKNTPLITQESFQIGEQWGRKIGQDFKKKIKEKGY